MFLLHLFWKKEVAFVYFLCYIKHIIKLTEGKLLTQKALTKKLTATYCSTTNNLFVHKNDIAAHNVYSNNSNKIIRNLSTQQKTAFNLLQNTCMQKTKNFVTNNALIKMLYNK